MYIPYVWLISYFRAAPHVNTELSYMPMVHWDYLPDIMHNDVCDNPIFELICSKTTVFSSNINHWCQKMSKIQWFQLHQIIENEYKKMSVFKSDFKDRKKIEKANMRIAILSLIIGLASAWMEIGHLTFNKKHAS